MKQIPGTEVTHGATWSTADIGDLTGRTALVTGANSGLGYETVRALTDHGAHVVMACRNQDKARKARDKLEGELTRSSLELLPLDLSDLDSVHRAADAYLGAHARLDIVVNNAGVMGTPYRQTADGFELQMATNHLGHFALTGLLLNRLVTTKRSRVVTVSSHMHHLGRLQIDDVGNPSPRNTWVTYGTTKLANLLFVQELSRRLAADGLATLAVAAHPGWTQSNLTSNGTALSDSRVRRTLGRAVSSTLGQTTATGALPILCAATSPAVHSGEYVGPSRMFGFFGPPSLTRPSRRGRDDAAAAALWARSEELTGVAYSLGAPV
jgi:NAD(P)-dependent dehydrogenase (short-subunit alcohol dehydrogenase family)